MPVLLRLIVGLLALTAVTAQAAEPELKRAENAVRVLNEIMQAPDKAIPRDLLQTAHAIVVVPDVLKAGFVIGGRRGEGLIAVKARDGTWSNPAFVNLTGGSVGFQVGVSSTDVVLVFRTERGVDSIVHGKFTIGADASAAAGPLSGAPDVAGEISRQNRRTPRASASSANPNTGANRPTSRLCGNTL